MPYVEFDGELDAPGKPPQVTYTEFDGALDPVKKESLLSRVGSAAKAAASGIIDQTRADIGFLRDPSVMKNDAVVERSNEFTPNQQNTDTAFKTAGVDQAALDSSIAQHKDRLRQINPGAEESDLDALAYKAAIAKPAQPKAYDTRQRAAALKVAGASDGEASVDARFNQQLQNKLDKTQYTPEQGKVTQRMGEVREGAYDATSIGDIFATAAKRAILREKQGAIGIGANIAKGMGSDAAEGMLEDYQAVGKEIDAATPALRPDSWKSNFISAVDSTAQMLPAIVSGIVLKNPSMAVALTPMLLQEGGNRAGDMLVKGYGAADAAAHGIAWAAAEGVPEVMSLGFFFKLFGKATGARQMAINLLEYAGTEVGTENLTSLTEHLLQKYSDKPELTADDLVKNLKDTTISTLMALPMMSGAGTVGGMVKNAPDMAKLGINTLRDRTGLGRALDDSVNNTEFTQRGIDAGVIASMSPNPVQVPAGQIVPERGILTRAANIAATMGVFPQQQDNALLADVQGLAYPEGETHGATAEPGTGGLDTGSLPAGSDNAGGIHGNGLPVDGNGFPVADGTGQHGLSVPDAGSAGAGGTAGNGVREGAVVPIGGTAAPVRSADTGSNVAPELSAFKIAADTGTLHQASGKSLPGEDAAINPIEMGRINGYPESDIMHFYAARRGYGRKSNSNEDNKIALETGFEQYSADLKDAQDRTDTGNAPTSTTSATQPAQQQAAPLWMQYERDNISFNLDNNPIDAEILNLRRMAAINERQNIGVDVLGMASDALKASGRLQEVSQPSSKKPVVGYDIDPKMAEAIAKLDAKMSPMADLQLKVGTTYTITYKNPGQPGAITITGKYDRDDETHALFSRNDGATVHIPRTSIALIDSPNSTTHTIPATPIPETVTRTQTDADTLSTGATSIDNKAPDIVNPLKARTQKEAESYASAYNRTGTDQVAVIPHPDQPGKFAVVPKAEADTVATQPIVEPTPVTTSPAIIPKSQQKRLDAQKARDELNGQTDMLSPSTQPANVSTNSENGDTSSKKLPERDIKMGDELLLDGEIFTVTAGIKDGVKAERKVSGNQTTVRLVHGDDVIRAKLAAEDNKPAQDQPQSTTPESLSKPVDNEPQSNPQSEAITKMADAMATMADAVKQLVNPDNNAASAISSNQSGTTQGVTQERAVRADESGSPELAQKGSAGSKINATGFLEFIKRYIESQPQDTFQYKQDMNDIVAEVERDWSNGNSDDYSNSFGPDEIYTTLRAENKGAYFDADGDLTNEGSQRYNDVETALSEKIARQYLGEPKRKSVEPSNPADMAKALHDYLEESGLDVFAISGSAKSQSKYFDVSVNSKRKTVRVADHALPVEYQDTNGTADYEVALYDTGDDIRSDGRIESEGVSAEEALSRAGEFIDSLSADHIADAGKVIGPVQESAKIDRMEPSHHAAAQQILDAIGNDKLSDYGLRVIPGEFEGDISIGDVLPNSRVWIDGEMTDDELHGTSAADIKDRTVQGVIKAIRNIGADAKPGEGGNGFYYGNRVVLIKGDRAGSGEDFGEGIFKNAKVVGIWLKPTNGYSEVIPNESITPNSDGVDRQPNNPAQEAKTTAEQEVMETREPVEVAQPIGVKKITFEATTLDGTKKVSGKLYELPGYKGPQLAVVEYKSTRGNGYRVYLPKSGVMLADNNGVGPLNDTLKIAVQRVGNAKQKQQEKVAQEAKRGEAAPIEDFGQKIEGSRKDLAAAISKELGDDEIATMPLSKIWPADLSDKIEDKFVAALAYAARSEIPSKPRKSYAVSRWVEKVKILRGMVNKVLSSDAMRAKAEALLNESAALKGFTAKVSLLNEIDRSQWGRIGTVGEYPDAYRYEGDGADTKKVASPMVKVVIDGATQYFNGVSSVTDAIDQINEKLGVEAKAKRMAFEVRGTDSKGYGINKKGDSEYRRLKTFKTAKEALDYRNSNYDDLVAAWEDVKNRDNVKKDDVRGESNRPRTAEDYRQGKDISTEQFQSTFGFRGGQFGKWVSQGSNAKERQWMLNSAYDALMDLSNILNIPPKAISLNGELGMAFGARGSGSASAHYESDTLVINLTKTRGAGTLAHEWFHALDNYFQRNRNAPMSNKRETRYITYSPEAYYENSGGIRIPAKDFEDAVAHEPITREWQRNNPTNGTVYVTQQRIGDKSKWIKHDAVRPEVEAKFAELVQALNDSPMTARASIIDKGKADGYWSRIIERAARSFENYVIAKMAENGYHNDYLANVVNIAEFKRDAGRYPYLKDEELAPVVEAFDNLFGELKTKETDQGTALYSQSQSKARNPHTLSTLTAAIDKAMGNGFTKLLELTDKFKIISSADIGKYLGEGARFSVAQEQTDTPAFKAWFKNSKIVDANGKPLILYHGGTRFDAFRKDTDSGAHYATDSMDVAQGYASQYEIEKAEIKPLYLRMENPLDLRTPEAFEKWTGITPEPGFSDYGILASMARNNTQIRSGGKLLEKAKAAGYDGIIFHDTDVMNRGVHTSYAFFDQTQAKLAPDTETKGGAWWDYPVRQGGNAGTFEGADIRYSKDGRILAFVRGSETFLVADNISSTDDNIANLLKHEIGIHALSLGRSEPEFQKILQQIETLRKMGNKQVQAARDRVPKDTPSHLILEETAGYLTEMSPQLSISQKLIAWFRSAIRKMGKSLPVLQRMQWFRAIDKMSVEDIVYAAEQALKSAPQTLAAARDRGTFLAGASDKLYSQLRVAIRDMSDKIFQGSAQNVRLHLMNNLGKYGLKKDEIFWTGLEEFLSMDKKVSKDEVLGFLDENAVTVKDVWLGKQMYRNSGDRNYAANTFRDQMLEKYGDGVMLRMSDDEKTELRRLEEGGVGDNTEHSTQVLPGGRDYRELLITLPEKQDARVAEINARLSELEKLPKTDTNIEKYQQLSNELYAMPVSRKLPSKQGNFISSHYPAHPNLIAHVRIDTRDDAQGRTGTFAEEFQSDQSIEYGKALAEIKKAVDSDFLGIIERMKKAGVLEVNCD